MNTLTEQELQEIESRCRDATAPPWRSFEITHRTWCGDPEQEEPYAQTYDLIEIVDYDEEYDYPDDHPEDAGSGEVIAEIGFCYRSDHRERANAEFIARARGDVPRLVAEVRRLQSLLAEKEAERDRAYSRGYQAAKRRARAGSPVPAGYGPEVSRRLTQHEAETRESRRKTSRRRSRVLPGL